MRRPPIIPPAAAAQVAERLARDIDYMRRLHNRLMALEHSKRSPLVADLAAAIEAARKAVEHWRRLGGPGDYPGDPILPPDFGRP